MKKRIGGLLYAGGVLAALLTGVQTLTAQPGTSALAETVCYICDTETGRCYKMICP